MRAAALALALSAPLASGGCVVYTVASTAVSVTATAIETTADVAGAAVGGAAGLVTGDDSD